MARANGGRFVLDARVTFIEPFLVGGLTVTAGLDTVPFVDGAGRVVVPGTSMAGVLRAWCERHVHTWCREAGVDIADIAPLDSVFGSATGLDSGASRLHVDDVIIDHDGFETVDHVGIDRHTAAAADGIKFDQTVVTAGARGTLRLTLVCGANEIPSSSSPTGLTMGLIVSGLEGGGLRLGRSTTKGLGAIEVSKLSVVTQRATREGIIARLRGNTAETLDPVRRDVTSASTTVTVLFRSETATFSKAGNPGTVVDVIPRVLTRNGRAELVIPGTSIRGVLRAECERIVRSVLDLRIDDSDGRLAHHQQVRAPLVDEIFGIAPTPRDLSDAGHNDTTMSEHHLGRAMATFPDLRADLCASEDWNRIERCATRRKTSSESERLKAETELNTLLDSVDGVLEFTHHVAVDRWTGGAAHQHLYSVLEPNVERWHSWTVSFDDDRLGQRRFAAVALVLNALRSLHDGAIGLGWGTHRGHGSVRVDSLQVTGRDLDGTPVQIGDRSFWSALRSAQPDMVSTISRNWAAWLESHTKEAS